MYGELYTLKLISSMDDANQSKKHDQATVPSLNYEQEIILEISDVEGRVGLDHACWFGNIINQALNYKSVAIKMHHGCDPTRKENYNFDIHNALQGYQNVTKWNNYLIDNEFKPLYNINVL